MAPASGTGSFTTASSRALTTMERRLKDRMDCTGFFLVAVWGAMAAA
jgi:hypothetical protein